MDPKAKTPPPGHPLELLPDFVAGRLAPEDSAAVRGHLDRCGDCRVELAAWRGISTATRDGYGPSAVAVPDGLMSRVVDRVAEEAAAGATRRSSRYRGFVWLARFVAAQTPLVRREIWPASAVVMAIGAALSLIVGSSGGEVPGTALALLAPFAAAIGIAMIYGQENDPALELALATPTSPRLVVVARLVVVLAWDLVLAVAATLVLAIANGPSVFMPLVSLWLGPMLLLGCLTLVLSLFVHSSLAIVATSILWIVRALEVAGEVRLHDLGGLTTVVDAVWQTSPLTLALALLLLAVALFLTPYREQFAARPSL